MFILYQLFIVYYWPIPKNVISGHICLSSTTSIGRDTWYHLVDHSALPLSKTTTLLCIPGQPALVDQIIP